MALQLTRGESEQRMADRTLELRRLEDELKAERLARQKAEAARAHFAAIIESSSDAIIGLTLDFIITSWNQSAARLYGYSAAEIVGSSVARLLPPDGREEFQRAWAQVQRGEDIEPWETTRIRKDGTRIDVSLLLSAVRDESGQLTGFSHVARDISKRRRAEKALRESEARLQAILDHSPSMIFLKDLDGRYLHFNRKFEQEFGLRLADTIGKTDNELFPASQAAAFRANDLKVLSQGVPMVFDEIAALADGPHISMASKFPLQDEEGRIYGIGGIVTDITERRRLETEVLRISDRERRRVAQDLHDGLGQELAAISCLTNVLKRDLEDQGSPEAPNAERICQLLGAALSQTRSLARGLFPVAPDPAGLMPALESLAASVTEAFKTRCTFECPQTVAVNQNQVATQLYRIAQEAVTNAVKHGRARRIQIELNATTDCLRLAIHDDGVGLDLITDRPKGLGLSIMSYRAEMIGATLLARRKMGRGTEVVCLVPLNEPSTRSHEDPATQGI